ncbi:hypothetical protein [Bacillus manliponensis]|uniref:hypothetical protein n=1 Tax=Bacillus manliponensis TaxID=574376 RepID=UPI0035159C72
MEWLFGVIGICSVILLLLFPVGVVSVGTNLFFMFLILSTMLAIMLLMQRNRPIFFFCIAIMVIVFLQIIALFFYPEVTKVF